MLPVVSLKKRVDDRNGQRQFLVLAQMISPNEVNHGEDNFAVAYVLK